MLVMRALHRQPLTDLQTKNIFSVQEHEDPHGECRPQQNARSTPCDDPARGFQGSRSTPSPPTKLARSVDPRDVSSWEVETEMAKVDDECCEG